MKAHDDPVSAVPGMTAAAVLAAVTLLAGCAAEPVPGIASAPSPCGMGGVLYCELAPHADRCQCFRHSEVRDMMRALTRR